MEREARGVKRMVVEEDRGSGATGGLRGLSKDGDEDEKTESVLRDAIVGR